MERKVDVRQALRAYQKIVEHGEGSGERHHLGELVAESDFDGYTISLSDGRVTVRILFHSRVDIDAPSGQALEDFIARLERVVAD